MKLAAGQVKTFFRLQRKHNVSTDFILRNMPAVLKFVHYAITPHFVLRQKLFRRRNRVFLRYNHPRKLIFDPTQLKKRRRVKRLHLQWSKRMVMYLRHYKTLQFVEDEVTNLPEEVVSKQMKEQLELLKTGKRTVPLLQDAEQHSNSSSSKIISTDEISEEDSESEEQSNRASTLLSTSINDIDGELEYPTQAKSRNIKTLPIQTAKPNGNFLDMLISKSKSITDEVTEMEPPKQSVKAKVSNEVIENDERENSNSSSDFFGFDDTERILGTTPGMLSTPLVRKSDSNAPFVSETLNAFMRDNSLERSGIIKMHRPYLESGLVFPNSTPPHLDRPALPEGLQCHRTVAEKRAFLQRTRNPKYFMINNVNTLCGELHRRAQGRRINKPSIEAMQWSSTVPLTRQAWKAATWLLTDVGNYYFQTINVDGENFRLVGCRGNSPRKFIRPHSSKCGKIVPVCSDECIDRITFRALRPIRTLERRSKLSDAGLKITFKACPLSQKIVHRPQDEEPVFGSLDVVRMPQVELEVFPQLQKPLNEIAKRYLQLILPYNDISREWAEFSVSTLVNEDQTKLDTQRAFTFKLPYRNDRDHVLVHRVYSRSEAFEGRFENAQLSFRKQIDQKRADCEETDLMAEECADILTEMLNSVAISCSENSFLKDDPDNIYQHNESNEILSTAKSVKKVPELHPLHVGQHNRKQSRMLTELRRLNATIIDAAPSKTEEDGATCDKESCRLGCVCVSLNEGTTIRQHCGKQRCVLDCKCKCPTVMRLETDGRTITTEDAFMLRRQATAKLARVEKEFTSTIVLTGSETLLINESQYDKKRRCTKIPKRYGDFVDADEPDFNDNNSAKRVQTSAAANVPLEPVLVIDKIYKHLKHCSVNIKRMRDVNNLVPFCMVHKVYKCNCKGQSTVGNPIVLEKREEITGGTTVVELSAAKARTLYSFDKEESKASSRMTSSIGSETSESDFSDSVSEFSMSVGKQSGRSSNLAQKLETRGRKADIDCIGVYMNAKANHCRRVVPIPKSTYLRRNKKRLAYVQLYIAENETDQTRLSLNEHVLRSVYYHKNNPTVQKRGNIPVKKEQPSKADDEHSDSSKLSSNLRFRSSKSHKRKAFDDNKVSDPDIATKKISRQTSLSGIEEGTSLLRVNRYKESKYDEMSQSNASNWQQSKLPAPSASNNTQLPQEIITVPKISQIFSLNAEAGSLETCTNAATAVTSDIPSQSTVAASCTEFDDKLQNVFQIVIKNMNSLVSKKMQDIDMALRRESKAIPAPNDEILCIIRWNNFLQAFIEGFVYLWEVRTVNVTFIAGTIRNIMPLVENALSVINIRALPKENLPLLGRMLIDSVRKSVTDGLAVVMQGQKMYWFVKGFLRPDKTRICQKPTPETHPLLTKKINILCRLLINQQANDLKKRQEGLLPQVSPTESLHSPIPHTIVKEKHTTATPPPQLPLSQPAPPQTIEKNSGFPLKVKVLPLPRNISDQASAILEQMVTQAYGVVRSNISFRNLLPSEGKEIYLPATIHGDHQWLVLDICNDFSHIFIPELRDLLTLDRIQKVMVYAVSKGRIVKMQFSNKSMFNAYVTSSSRRKLYFGPFRNEFQTPKLILMQSVDGQMMLREVYEAKHNVKSKTERTCSFWLTQRQGKLFLDIETMPLMEAQEDIHEITDDEEDCLITNKTPAIEITSIPQSIDTSVLGVGNVPNTTEALPLQQDNLPAVIESDDDDDCVIINDDDNCVTSLASPAEERTNFTISYTGENSSLVVIQNECDIVPSTLQRNNNNGFTILTPGVVQPLVNSQETGPLKPINPIVSLESNVDTESIEKSIVNPSVPTTVSKDVVNTYLKPPSKVSAISLPLSTPTTSAALKQTSVEALASPSVNSLANNSNLQPSPQSIESATPEPESSGSKVITNSIKWNNNVTITKLQTDSDITQCSTPKGMPTSQAIASTLARKSLTVISTANAKIIGQSQLGQQNRLSLPPNSQSQVKATVVVKSPATQKTFWTAQDYRRHLANNPHITACQSAKIIKRQALPQQIRQTTIQRQVVPKIVPAVVNQRFVSGAPQRPLTTSRPTLFSQSGLTIRTPAAINTLAKDQQIIRHSSTTTTSGFSFIRPANSLTRTQVPSLLSSPSHVTYNVASFKSPTNTFLSPTYVKPATAPQQGQFKRIVQNQSTVAPPGKIIKLTQLPGVQSSCTYESTEGDPLHISTESSNTVIDPLLKPKLPNEVKALVKIINPPLIPSGSGGVKRDSTGTIVNVNRISGKLVASKQGYPISKSIPSTVVTTVSNSLPTQTTQVKGIPIDLPRLKKFAIIGSPNTTVITSIATSQSAEVKGNNKGDPSPRNTSSPKKLVASGLIKCLSPSSTSTSLSPAVTARSVLSATTSPSSSSTTLNPSINKVNTLTQYGYFHANVEGLPKFVVKRVNDDFLIKVPNFNGILKLTGMTTVRNYLNQYTTQKCGKTQEDISNLQWTFKAQDRSKLSVINRSNLSLINGGVSNPVAQKLLTVESSLSTRTSSPKITNNNTKPIFAPITKNDSKNTIVILDDK